MELLEVQGQMELGRVAPQKRIVLLLLSDSGRVLRVGVGGKEGTCQKMNWLDFNVNESLCSSAAASYVILPFREMTSR